MTRHSQPLVEYTRDQCIMRNQIEVMSLRFFAQFVRGMKIGLKDQGTPTVPMLMAQLTYGHPDHAKSV